MRTLLSVWLVRYRPYAAFRYIEIVNAADTYPQHSIVTISWTGNGTKRTAQLSRN